VTIKEQVAEYNKHHEALQTKLVAGSGAPDIAAVDEGFIVQFRSQADKFANLNELGADKVKDRWLPWKWQQSPVRRRLHPGRSGHRRRRPGDVLPQGPFREGRPALGPRGGRQAAPHMGRLHRDGNTFVAKSGGAKWVDAATNMFNPILAQQSEGYFNKDDQLVIDPPRVSGPRGTRRCG
jgi:cellobiose transport system substrate-binding protein